MSKFIDQIGSVEMPDFDRIFTGVSRRVAVRRIVVRTVAAAVVVMAIIVAIPRNEIASSAEVVAYNDEQFEFSEYDPLSSLFEE